MNRIVLSVVIAASVAACSGEDPAMDAGVQASACGIAAESPAAECTGLDQCGAGAQNFAVDPTCDNCPHRADSHLCEAGTCRPLESLELVSVLLSVGTAGVGANAFTIATISPIMADGSKVTCAQLMSDGCQRLANPALNVTNSTHKSFASGPASNDMVYQTGISAEAGTGRLLFVQATDDPSGDGDVKAWGCVEDITVPLPAGMNRIGIELVAP